MSVEIRAARPWDGSGLARIWLDNARYYLARFLDSAVSIPVWERRMGYRRRSGKLTKRLS
jgi:hypothetical protein